MFRMKNDECICKENCTIRIYAVKDNVAKISIMISKSDQEEVHISDHHRNATMLIRQKKLGARVRRSVSRELFELRKVSLST